MSRRKKKDSTITEIKMLTQGERVRPISTSIVRKGGKKTVKLTIKTIAFRLLRKNRGGGSFRSVIDSIKKTLGF